MPPILLPTPTAERATNRHMLGWQRSGSPTCVRSRWKFLHITPRRPLPVFFAFAHRLPCRCIGEARALIEAEPGEDGGELAGVELHGWKWVDLEEDE